MPIAIRDRFTRLKGKMSRQRLWQLRKASRGHCITCGKPAVTANHCLRHAIKFRDKQHRVTGAKKEISCLTRRLEAKLKNSC